ncbi:MAG: ATP-binding cassette domain-containing protein [Myxococcales bacterium]
MTTAVFHRHCPPGFRAMGAIGIALCAVGSAQLVALVFRDEPHPIAAAVLALLLGGGGAVLVAFVRRGTRGVVAPSSQRSPSDALTAAALGVFACATVAVLLTSGIFFPARVALFWTGKLPASRLVEPPLAMMLAGTSIVALGAMATAALCGALWLFLYARGSTSAARFTGAALSFAGAVPYVAFALVVRALYCPPVAFLAAGRWLAVRPDDQLAYRSLYAMAPGYLTASVALGLCVGRGLWSFLEEARTAEERSDSFLAATIRGEKPWEIVLRQGLWQRRRRDLAALLLGSAAAAVLIDILSNTLIDSFRPPGFPTYPSLGAALFLRGIGPDGIPLPLGMDLTAAHVLVVLAALLLVVAQTFPHHAARIALRDGSLRVGARVLANGVASPHGLPPRPSLQWVLGTSGSGKSSLLKAWSGQLENAILVPQDPDEALPSALSGTDVARLAAKIYPRGDRVLWDLLGRLGDGRLRRSLFDPFTPVSSLSRGERQRLVVCLAMTRARRDPDCTLLFDEPTSAQDASRTRALLDCVRELLPAGFGGASSLVLAAHDPESLDALLGDRAGEAIPDHVLWLEDGRAHEFTVRSGPGAARQWAGATARPHGLQGYLSAMDTLLDARSSAPEGAESSSLEAGEAGEAGFRLLRSRIDIGGKPYAVSPATVVRGGELFVLHGPSGCGKSTILRAIARRHPSIDAPASGPSRLATPAKPAPPVELGYVMQDPGRAFPAETPVDEVLGTGSTAERDRVRRWFGPDLGEEMRARPISALSEGERQRVVFAGEVVRIERAAQARLRLLLLDEPFGALDPAAHLRLMNSLLAWLREGEGQSAAVLVSHSPEMDLGLARACGIPTTEWTIEAGEG